MKEHFERFARYNRWANRRLYGAAELLSETKLWEDRKAFFGSLMGTLNHLLVGDRLWLGRLTGSTVELKLDQVLHRDLPSLRQSRQTEDERLLAFVGSLEEQDITAPFAYKTTKGEPFTQPLDQVLTHVFNHQTHHRGQAHAILNQLGQEPPVLDFIYFLREV